jgi:hypothetical protein
MRRRHGEIGAPSAAVVVFDLNDALARYTKRGANVPHKARHALRRLHKNGGRLCAVSYNPMASFLVTQLGQGEYIDYTVTDVPLRTSLFGPLAVGVALPPWFLYLDD